MTALDDWDRADLIAVLACAKGFSRLWPSDLRRESCSGCTRRPLPRKLPVRSTTARAEDILRARPNTGGAAFDDFWREHFPRLVTALRGRGLDGEAEDIAQETLVRAFQLRDRLDFSSPMGPWLRTVAFRLASDRHKLRSRQVPTDPLELPNVADDSPDIEERFAVSQAMEFLPERQRLAIDMVYLKDRDPGEAGRILGLNRTGLNQLLYRARLNLQTAYKRIGEAAWGFLLVPLRSLRRFREEVAARFGRSLVRSGRAEHVHSATMQQFTTGLVALFFAVGGAPTPQVSEPPRLKPEAPAHDSTPAMAHETRPPIDDERQASNASPLGGKLGNEQPPSTPKRDEGGAQKLVDDLITPNKDVDQPEDARITSLAASPRFSQDSTLFAAGITACRGTLCPSVLFRSTDGGASWDRLEGRNFYGASLHLPPGYGAGDDRIFAMGPTGLQVSSDGGATFLPAAVAGANQAIGSAAVSPAFNAGDPTILIGAQTLMRYRDDLRTIETVPSTAISGPLEPAFSPAYPEDGRILVGAIRFDPTLAQTAATLFTCADALCSSSSVSTDDESPRVRLTEGYVESGIIHAFTSGGIFVSTDYGVSFDRLLTPWMGDVVLQDLNVDSAGKRLFAAVQSAGRDSHPDAGLYTSDDGGLSWRKLPSPLFEAGVNIVVTEGTLLLAGLGEDGLACSVDGGASWATRCRGSAGHGAQPHRELVAKGR